MQINDAVPRSDIRRDVSVKCLDDSIVEDLQLPIAVDIKLLQFVAS